MSQWKKAGEVGDTVMWLRLAVGKKLPEPSGQRWPNPLLFSWYHHGSGYECEANFRTPDEYIARQDRPTAYPNAHETDPTS